MADGRKVSVVSFIVIATSYFVLQGPTCRSHINDSAIAALLPFVLHRGRDVSQYSANGKDLASWVALLLVAGCILDIAN